MTESAPTRSALPSDLPILAMLGLRVPSDGDWERYRGLQYSSLADNILARILLQLLVALTVAGLSFRIVPPLILAGWVVVLAVAVWFAAAGDAPLGDVDRRRLGSDEVNRQTMGVFVSALAWSAPMAGFGYYGDPLARSELWTVLSTLMIAMVVLAPGVPRANVVFSAVIGAGATIGFLFAREFAMAPIAAIFTVVTVMGSIASGRSYLIARIAEAATSENDEVVSLLLREFEEGEADWLWQTDAMRRVRSISPRFAFALGKTPQELEGRSLIELIAGPDQSKDQALTGLRELAEQMQRRESFSNLLVEVTIGDQQRWWELSGTPKLDDNGNFEGFRGVGSDVTEQQQSSEKIARMARYDSLTTLPNRMMVTESLGEALRYAQHWRTRCAFLMIDLDRFKAVNDTLGHLVGDQLLQMVAERLRSIATTNELCGRLGGDEFAIVIRDASDPSRVTFVAHTVIDQLSRPYELDHHTLFIGASVGSAVGPRDGSTVETLMRNADLALYRSKEEGGGKHFNYEPSLHAMAEERRKLESSLRRALERDEFDLNYQPVVSARDEQIVGFEALLRWNRSEHGPVSPAKFIPLAEDTRLVVPIGQWAMLEACREATNWPGHVRVAVNVSGEQLLEPGFVSSVVAALSQSGLPARRLEIEVTESVFVRDPGATRNVLEQIMGLGCGVALDDFGTGYSSLAYIRDLRFSTIKIDRTFVKGAAQGTPESVAIIRAVVTMADSLQMTTTAEGVETEAELELVRSLGCTKIQGFYYGRPMEAVDARGLFTGARRIGSGG